MTTTHSRRSGRLEDVDDPAAAIRHRIAKALLQHVELMGGWILANPYVVRHLPSYLVDDTAALETIFTDPWYLARALELLRTDGLAELLDETQQQAKRESPFALVAVAKVIRRARVALNRDPSQLAAQLIARLRNETDPALIRLVQSAEGVAPAIWLRPISGSMDWQAPLEAIQAFEGGKVRALQFADIDGKTTLVVGFGDQVVLWTPTKGEPGPELHNDGLRVTELAIGRMHGQTVVAAAALHDGVVSLRQPSTGRTVGPTVQLRACSLALAPAPPGVDAVVGNTFDHPNYDDITGTVVGNDGTTLWSSQTEGTRLCTVAGQLGVVAPGAGPIEVTDSAGRQLVFAAHRPDPYAPIGFGTYHWRPVVAVASADRKSVQVSDAHGPVGPVAIFDFRIRCVAVADVDGDLLVAVANDTDEQTGIVALCQPLLATAERRPLPIEVAQTCGIGLVDDRLVALLPDGSPAFLDTLEYATPDDAQRLTVVSGVQRPFGPPPRAQAVRRSPDARDELTVREPGEWPVTASCFGRLDGRDLLVRGSLRGAVWVFDRAENAFTAGPFATVPQPLEYFWSEKGAPDGALTAVGIGRLGGQSCVATASGPHLTIYDMTTGKARPPLKTGGSPISALAIGTIRGRSLLIRGSTGGAVRVYDVTTGEHLAGVTMDKEIQKVWLAGTRIVVLTHDRPPNVFDLQGI